MQDISALNCIQHLKLHRLALVDHMAVSLKTNNVVAKEMESKDMCDMHASSGPSYRPDVRGKLCMYGAAGWGRYRL